MSDILAVYDEHLMVWLPPLLQAAGNTLRVTALALALAFVVGLPLALAKQSSITPLRWFATGYIEAMRGIPALAILFLIYFGLLDFGLAIDAFPAAVIGFGLSGHLSGTEPAHRLPDPAAGGAVRAGAGTRVSRKSEVECRMSDVKCMGTACRAYPTGKAVP